MATTPSPLPEELHARCAQEPIHTPGATQPFAAILSGRIGDDTVRHCSANLPSLFPGAAVPAAGLSLSRVLPDLPDDLLDFSSRDVTRTLALPSLSATATCHAREGRWYVQIEPRRAHEEAPPRTVDPDELIHLSRHETLEPLLDDAIGIFRRLLGHHRVMIYRFHADWHGEVVAESVDSNATRYLGLHFPASDIPAQARQLYLVERIRLIPDVELEPVPLLRLSATEEGPLDLTGCTARAISPIHREYLRNMGVRSTFVISLVVEGRLWGLVACHHHAPRTVPPLLRNSALTLAEMLAGLISNLTLRETFLREATFRQQVIQLGMRLDGRRDPWEAFAESAADLLAPLHAEGVALIAAGRASAQGRTPPAPVLEGLRAWLGSSAAIPEGVVALESPPAPLRDEPNWPVEIAGLLAAPIEPGDAQTWLVVFRADWPREVRWGGDPRHTVSLRADGSLAPRASFDAWIERQRGCSRPWKPAERDYVRQVALTLRNGQLVQERWVAENDFRRSEARRSAMLAAMPDLIFVVDDRDLLLDLHAPPGGPGARFIGRPLSDLLPGPAVRALHLARAELGSGRELALFYYTLAGPGETARRFEGRLVHCSPGEVLCVARDITELHEAQAAVSRLALVARHTANAVIFTDCERRIVWVNEGFTRVSGYSAGEVLGRTPAFLQGTETDSNAIAAIRSAIAARRGYRGELLNYTRGGRAYWIELEILPHFTSEGVHAGFIGVQIDITARKAQEDLLRRSLAEAERANHLLEAASRIGHLGYWEIFRDGRPVVWSDLTYEIHDLEARRPTSLEQAVSYYLPEHRARVAACVGHTLETGEPFEFEAEIITARGRHAWVSARGIAVVGENGAITGARGVVQDITHRRTAETTLRENEERLRILIESIPAAVFLKDGDGRLLFVNQRGIEALRLKTHSWQGKTDARLAEELPARAPFFEASVLSDEIAWKAGRSSTFEQTFAAAPDTPRDLTYEITKVPLFHPDGARRSLIVVANDITARKEAADLIERERRLFAAGPVAVIVWKNSPGRPVEYVSDNIERILGYTSDRFVRPDFRYNSLIHPADFERVRLESRESHLRRDAHYEQSYRLRAADGTFRWIYDCTRVEYTPAGEVASLRGYLFDQTRLKAAERALRQLDEQIASISVHVPGMLYEFRPLADGRACFPYVSEGIRDLFALTPEQVRDDASPFFARVHPEDLAPLGCSIDDSRKREADWSADFRIQHPERGLRWMHASSSPRRLDDGVYVWDGYCFDITERKNAEESLLLEGKREAIERLAGGVAHDFNNYLSALALSTDLLLSLPQIDLQVREIALTMNREIDAATGVARQLLAFTKDQPIHRQTVGVDRFLRECAAFALRGSAMRALVDVPNRALEVTTDPDLLRQAIFNLILNSRQAMKDKGAVLLSAEQADPATLRIRVGDTGPGIPESHRLKIFEPYFTTKSAGSGLGLFVVRSILRRLGGNIELDPGTTHGATFIITLPVTAAPDGNEAAATPDGSSEKPAPDETPTDKVVLILEDEPGQTRPLADFFSLQGIACQLYEDGARLLEAAQPLRERSASVACLLDITIRGGLGGLEIAPALRELLPDAQILLSSGYSAEWEQKKDTLVGLNIGFIAKPYHLRELRGRLYGGAGAGAADGKHST